MKKEGIKNLIALLASLFIFISFSASVISPGGESGDVTTQMFIDYIMTEGHTSPTQNAPGGYWRPCVLSATEGSDVNCVYPSSLAATTGYDKEGGDSDNPIALNDIYSLFDLESQQEITYLKFALYPRFYQGADKIYNSHIYNSPTWLTDTTPQDGTTEEAFSWSEGGLTNPSSCIQCSNADDLVGCFLDADVMQEAEALLAESEFECELDGSYGKLFACLYYTTAYYNGLYNDCADMLEGQTAGEIESACGDLDDPAAQYAAMNQEVYQNYLDNDNTCVEVNILDRTSCSEMADWSQQYCEGVSDVGPNVGILGVENTGTGGKGGCQQAPDTYAVSRTTVRDWRTGTALSADTYKTPFRTDAEPIVGGCCGNDLSGDINDLGILGTESGLKSKYACVPACLSDKMGSSNCAVTSSDILGYIWKNANTPTYAFSITRLKTEITGSIPYELMSNGENWFVCGVDGLFSDVYVTADSDDQLMTDEGVLLNEYWTLPLGEANIDFGTTESTGSEDTSDLLEGGDMSGVDSGVGAGSATDIVSDDTITDGMSGVISSAFSGPCDIDGDGYDIDPAAIIFLDDSTPYESCTPDIARQPYDCNDSISSANPGAVNYCVAGENQHLDCGASICINDTCAYGGCSNDNLDGTINYDMIKRRIMCHADGNVLPIAEYSAIHLVLPGDEPTESVAPLGIGTSTSGFAECCGWDLQNCINSAKGRREGAAIHTLLEFTNYTAGSISQAIEDRSSYNAVLRYGIAKTTPGLFDDIVADTLGEDITLHPYDAFRIGFPVSSYDEKYRYFADYEYLEFDIFFTTNFELWIWFAPKETAPITEAGSICDYDFAQHNKLRVLDYVVGEPRLQQWLHVKIPVSDIGSPTSPIDLIVLASNIYRVAQLGTSVTLDIAGSDSTGPATYSNMIAVDKFSLTPKTITKSPTEDLKPEPDTGDSNYYCTGGWPPKWIGDLDDASPSDYVGDTMIPIGKAACNAIPSFQWTGAQCCGDDGTINPTTHVKTLERYIDTEGACWNGRYVAENERFMPVVYYAATYKGSGSIYDIINWAWKPTITSCSSNICNYPYDTFGYYTGPNFGISVPTAALLNPFTTQYALAFIDETGNYYPVSSQGNFAPNISALMRATVPLEVQYSEDKFKLCNPSLFLDLINDTDNEPLFTDANSEEYGNCESAGIYICDDKNGRNKGWDSEQLSYYPGTNITYRDQDNLSTAITPAGAKVEANYRTSIKSSYNLVPNGGFEKAAYLSENKAFNSAGNTMISKDPIMKGWSVQKGTGYEQNFVMYDTTAPKFYYGNDKTLYLRYFSAAIVSVNITPENDKTYTVSFAYKGTVTFALHNTTGYEGTKTLTSSEWATYSYTFKAKGTGAFIYQLVFGIPAKTEVHLDEVQVVEAPEAVKFVEFDAGSGCCPEDYCWTGRAYADHPTCIHDQYFEKNVSQPPVGWDLWMFGNLEAPNGFRCIDGTWKYQRAKFDPLYSSAGYCPIETQCFVGAGAGTDPAQACIEDGGVTSTNLGDDPTKMYPETFYCYQGNWTTRTKEIALQMLRMANDSDRYTIFCDRFDMALNSPDEPYGGFYRDIIGDNAYSLFNIVNENAAAVEEFCVLNMDGRIIAGVALNQAIDETIGQAQTPCTSDGDCFPGTCDTDAGYCASSSITDTEDKSFIQMIRDDAAYCDAVKNNTDGDYHPCSAENDVYYNAKLNTVIFGMNRGGSRIQEVPFGDTTSLISKSIDAIKAVISKILSVFGIIIYDDKDAKKAELDFVGRADSFDKLYISYESDGPSIQGAVRPRTINAVRDTKYSPSQGHQKTILTAEYTNYQSDICKFFYNSNSDYIRKQIANTELSKPINCVTQILGQGQWAFIVTIEEPLLVSKTVMGGAADLFGNIVDLDEMPVLWKGGADNFWNDITAKIRTQAPKMTDIPLGAVAPDFTIIPAASYAGLNMTFLITDTADNVLAATWDFGDGTTATTYLPNTPFAHTYEQNGTYTVTLRTMNRSYAVSAETTQTVIVAEPVAISIEDLILDEESNNVQFTIALSGGMDSEPYPCTINWAYIDSHLQQMVDDQALTVSLLDSPEETVTPDPSAEVSHTYHTDWLQNPIITISCHDINGVEAETSMTINLKEIIPPGPPTYLNLWTGGGMPENLCSDEDDPTYTSPIGADKLPVYS